MVVRTVTQLGVVEVVEASVLEGLVSRRYAPSVE